MKKIYLIFLALFTLAQLQAQKGVERKLIWSVGQVELTRGATVQVSYPIMVAIDDAADAPQLGLSTMRFFYDAASLSDLKIENLQNTYQISGLKQSKDVYGETFGFAGGGGVFVQFNLLPNQQELLDISTVPTHVMDLSFTVMPGARIPLCVPLVLDNNPSGKSAGLAHDAGYLLNDGGINGTYYLNKKYNAIHLADDEVQNYLWQRSASFDNLVDRLDDLAGHMVREKSNSCLEPKIPVATAELQQFEAWKEANQQVRLDWNTISEFNNDLFEVQRSNDGFTFETIGTVKGQWNAVAETKYEFLDKHPKAGINYYRLVQVDNNGRTQYSSVKEIAFETSNMAFGGDWKVSYYPNPSKGIIQLSSNEVFTNFEINVYDNNGRFVLKRNDVHSGSSLDLSALSAGIYSVSLVNVNDQIVDSQKIVIIDK